MQPQQQQQSDEILDLTALVLVATHVATQSVVYIASNHVCACLWPECGARIYSDVVEDVPHTPQCPVLLARQALSPISAPDTGKGAE